MEQFISRAFIYFSISILSENEPADINADMKSVSESTRFTPKDEPDEAGLIIISSPNNFLQNEKSGCISFL